MRDLYLDFGSAVFFASADEDYNDAVDERLRARWGDAANHLDKNPDDWQRLRREFHRKIAAMGKYAAALKTAEGAAGITVTHFDDAVDALGDTPFCGPGGG